MFYASFKGLKKTTTHLSTVIIMLFSVNNNLKKKIKIQDLDKFSGENFSF
jgi:hypothetical protein